MDVQKLEENMKTHNFRRVMDSYSCELCSKTIATNRKKNALLNKAKKAAEDAYKNYKFSFPESWSNPLKLTPQEIEKERYDIEFKMRIALYAAASLFMSQKKYVDKATKTTQSRASYEQINQVIENASEGLGYPDLPILVKTLIAKHNRKMPNPLTPYLERE